MHLGGNTMNYSKKFLLSASAFTYLLSSSLYSVKLLEFSKQLKNCKPKIARIWEQGKTNVQLRAKPKYVLPFVKRSGMSWLSAAAILQATNKPALALTAGALTELGSEVLIDHRWIHRTKKEKEEFFQKKDRCITKEPLYHIVNKYSDFLIRYKEALEATAEYLSAEDVNELQDRSTKGCYPGTIIAFFGDDEKKLNKLWQEVARYYDSKEELYELLNIWMATIGKLLGNALDSKINGADEEADLPVEIITNETKRLTELSEIFTLMLDRKANITLFEIAQQERKNNPLFRKE